MAAVLIPGSIGPATNKKPGERVPGLYLLACLEASKIIAIGSAINQININLIAFHSSSRIIRNTCISVHLPFTIIGN